MDVRRTPCYHYELSATRGGLEFFVCHVFQASAEVSSHTLRLRSGKEFDSSRVCALTHVVPLGVPRVLISPVLLSRRGFAMGFGIRVHNFNLGGLHTGS